MIKCVCMKENDIARDQSMNIHSQPNILKQCEAEVHKV